MDAGNKGEIAKQKPLPANNGGSGTDKSSDTKAAVEARVQQLFSQRYGRIISVSEARELAKNLSGFFALLMRWKASSNPDAPSEKRA